MIYLNHELLTTKRIIKFIKDKKSSLNLRQFQQRLKSIFFKKDLSTETILSNLASDSRFASYPKLKALIEILLSLEDPGEIEHALQVWFPLSHNGGLGFDTSCYRGGYPRGLGRGGVGRGAVWATHRAYEDINADLAAITRLEDVRTADLELSRANLSSATSLRPGALS